MVVVALVFALMPCADTCPMGIAVDRVAAKRGQYRTAPSETIEVKGYTRADGTKVPDHKRAAPPPAKEKPMLGNLTAALQSIYANARRRAEPTTAAGYAEMFDQVPTDEWGGGDISLSVVLPDGRRVWLFGDTLSKNNGFVHSTALVQSGGSLSVSHGGKQLLPDGRRENGRQTIYWVESVKALGGNRIAVTAAPMSVGTAGPFDFRRDQKRSRRAVCTVDRQGNVNFKRWTGMVPAPTTDFDSGSDTTPHEPGHWTYGTIVHDIKLANGKYLTTRSQNWDDGFENHMGPGGLQYKQWRPIFSESTPAERLLWKLRNPGYGT